MNERVLVKQLQSLPDGPVSVSGWVETVRDQKKVQFVILRDETGAVQLVNPATRPAAEPVDGAEAKDAEALALTDTISALTTGTFLTVNGQLKHDERVKLGGVRSRSGPLTSPQPRCLRRRSRRTAHRTSAWTGASSICASVATT